ncbi:MAG: LPS export ABC transporter periplasmic protein LptC [Alphaproteobacteria bacterium]|nr:LPS export ABC transporter periplasmic protein LptC [Alphaproteobacteria bacterium]
MMRSILAGHVEPSRPARIGLGVARYSRFVFLMKVLLPALAVTLLGLVVIWPGLTAIEVRFSLGFADVDGRVGDTLTMTNPRYFGSDAENRPFTVTALEARRSHPESPVVMLSSPTADMSLDNGAGVMLDADAGYYLQRENAVDLAGSVDLYHDQGYEVHTSSARIELGDATVRGVEPVLAQGSFGIVEGEGFTVGERGRRIEVTGRSRAVLNAAGGRK